MKIRNFLKTTLTLTVAAALLHLPSFAASYTQDADKLFSLGLFRGTENGYELDATFTRAEAATMLTRILAKESAALTAPVEEIFSDVPKEHWASQYVKYCFNNSITKGTGDNTYSPEEPISGAEYMTLVMRALGYVNAEPENVDLVAAEYGLLSSREAKRVSQVERLSRDEMVNVSYRALSVAEPDGEKLIEKLISERAVDKTKAEELGLLEEGRFEL